MQAIPSTKGAITGYADARGIAIANAAHVWPEGKEYLQEGGFLKMAPSKDIYGRGLSISRLSVCTVNWLRASVAATSRPTFDAENFPAASNMIDIAKAKPVDPSIVDIAMNLSSGPHLILRFIHTNKCLSGPVRNLVKALNSIPPILYFCLYDATFLLSELVG